MPLNHPRHVQDSPSQDAHHGEGVDRPQGAVVFPEPHIRGGMQAVPVAAGDDRQQKGGLHVRFRIQPSEQPQTGVPGRGAVDPGLPQPEPGLAVAPELGHRGPSLSYNRRPGQSQHPFVIPGTQAVRACIQHPGPSTVLTQTDISGRPHNSGDVCAVFPLLVAAHLRGRYTSSAKPYRQRLRGPVQYRPAVVQKPDWQRAARSPLPASIPCTRSQAGSGPAVPASLPQPDPGLPAVKPDPTGPTTPLPPDR